MAGYRWWAFGVDYHILWLPIRRQVDEVNVAKDLPFLYKSSMSGILCKLLTRLSPEPKQ